MFTVEKYPHGTFSWADLASTDARQSKSFYTALMGWDTDDIPIGNGAVYTMLKYDGATVAGLSQMQPDMAANGIPSHWNNYVTVDDVDTLATQVSELGGTVIAPPMDVFENGRMMVLQDPGGAMLSLWQPRNHIGAKLVNTPGAMSWNQLSTRDVEKVSEFYSNLLGWQINKDEQQNYYYILNKGRMNGGVMPMDENFGEMPSAWATYFSVADIDATAAKAQDLGGTLIMPVMDAGGNGRLAVIADPTGAVCTFIQLPKPDVWDV